MITSDFIKVVAKSLEHLKKDVVFTGGAVVNLYSTDTAATDIRPTDDIDCVVKAVRRSDYNNFEEQLRKLGFVNDLSGKAPICRYICKGIKVDFIPTCIRQAGCTPRRILRGESSIFDLHYPMKR